MLQGSHYQQIGMTLYETRRMSKWCKYTKITSEPFQGSSVFHVHIYLRNESLDIYTQFAWGSLTKTTPLRAHANTLLNFVQEHRAQGCFTSKTI